MSGWVAGISAASSLAGSAISSRGASEGAGRTKRAQFKMLGMQLEQAERAARIAGQLEGLANKMLNDQPLSEAENTLLNSAQQLANKQINQATQEGIEQAMGAAAGTGFLKSGRTQDQIRKLAIEGSTARQGVALSREQAAQAAIERNRQQALGLLGGVAGFNLPQVNIPDILPGSALFGQGLSSLGAAGIGVAGDIAKANAMQKTNVQPTRNVDMTNAVDHLGNYYSHSGRRA